MFVFIEIPFAASAEIVVEVCPFPYPAISPKGRSVRHREFVIRNGIQSYRSPFGPMFVYPHAHEVVIVIKETLPHVAEIRPCRHVAFGAETLFLEMTGCPEVAPMEVYRGVMAEMS